jgi:hypothetical protein
MGQSTFSGPLRVGTAGQSGSVPVYLTYKAPAAQIVTTPGTTVTIGRLPPNAKLLSSTYILDCSVALVGATNCGVSLGKPGDNVFFAASANSGAVVGRTTPTLVAANLINAGGSDGTDLTATFIAATANATAGEVQVVVGYAVP